MLDPRKLATVCLGTVLLSGTASSAPFPGSIASDLVAAPDPLRPSATSAGCSGGLVYDDGTIEAGLKPQSLFSEGQIVMRFDPGSPVAIESVCTCWGKTSILQSSEHDFDVVLYDDDGPGGGPGTLLGRKSVRATGIESAPRFQGYEVSDLGITVASGSVYIGVDGVGGAINDPAFCGDNDGPGSQPIYTAGSGDDDWSDLRDDVPGLRAVGVRATVAPADDGGGGGGGGGDGASEPPPPGPWLTTSEQPGFELKVRITPSGGQPIRGAKELPCIGETLCVSGALAGRPEVFAKVIGPRPNGFLWVQISRFTPSQVEAWVRQTSSGDVRYYRLPAVPPASDEVSGLQDRRAFSP